MLKYEDLATEKRNAKSENIDKMPTYEMLQLMNDENKLVPQAIDKVIPQIEKTVDLIVQAMKSGGRLIYIGAGTSGRLGVVDASECPPTFGVSPDLVRGILAGGEGAMFRAVEGAEDNFDGGKDDLLKINFNKTDICIGISASGSAAYVAGAIDYAHSIGAKSVYLTCNPNIDTKANIVIAPQVGAEVITGSTRLKAGTSQKLILNMISTSVMVKMGLVCGNIMTNVTPTNKKLIDRAERNISSVLGISQEEAKRLLSDANGCIQGAIALYEQSIK